MRFKIFGVTVFIGKNIGKIFQLQESDERIKRDEGSGNIPYVTVLDSHISNYVWGFVKNQHHRSYDDVKSLIPSIIMFRDLYKHIRGISVKLVLCKEFIESKVIKIDGQYELFETYYKCLKKIRSKGEKNG